MIIKDALGQVPTASPDLREIDVGHTDGQRFNDLSLEHPELRRQFDADGLDIAWPGGESQRQLRARVERAVRMIIGRHLDETVMVAAHGGPLGWMLTILLHDPRPGYPDWRHETCGISDVLVPTNFATEPGRLIRHNDCRHLATL